MLELRAAGVGYRQIAQIMQRSHTVVENWLLRNAGRVIGVRCNAYHGKAATHRRCGVYFDISKMTGGADDHGE